MKLNTVRLSWLVCVALGATSAPPLAQQQPDGIADVSAAGDQSEFVVNLRDVEIRVLAEQVASITGRTLVLDPSITGTVTVISSKAMPPDEVWNLFQSVLGSQGFSAIPSGDIWRIVTQQVAKENAATGSSEATGRLDVVTKTISLENFPAATAVGALRPLVAAFGYIEAVPETNSLVITDTAENVARIEGIAQSLDDSNDLDILTLTIQNGDASEIASSVQTILSNDPTTAGARLSVDTRANLLVIRADSKLRERITDLVRELDVPGRAVASAVPVTRVYNLKFADATALSEVLRGLVGNVGATNPVAGSLQTAPDSAEGDVTVTSGVVLDGAVASFGSEDITIQPVIENNSIVIRARAEVHNDLGQLIATLDQRRPQVLIEAAIVEVSGEISEQLGVQLGLGAAAAPGSFAATSFSTSGQSLQNILRLLGNPTSNALSSGLAIGLSNSDEFGLLLQAFGSSNKANLLSTPSITTLDNEAAEIIVGQNVPFRTGSFSTDGNSQNPFTTIERRDVGITMNVVPRVNVGDVVQLDISQEVSSLLNTNVAGAADLVTNRRSIKTTVLADNGSTIVLGGLISDDRQSVRSEVPGLGRVPIIGNLFRSRQEASRRQTLFVFLRPTILRTASDVTNVSSNRFQRLQAIEIDNNADKGSLLSKPKNGSRIRMEIDGLY